ncbi:uncharacterized protein LOC144752872 [Lissotriton helveticus]
MNRQESELWQLVVECNAKQQDSYNCGVFLHAGAPSGSGAAAAQVSAPATADSAVAGPSSMDSSQEVEDSSAMANEDDSGHALLSPHSPQLSQSPPFQFSPENSPTQSQPAPATAPARRSIVSPLSIMEGAAGQAPAPTPVTPVAQPDTQQTSTNRRHPRTSSSANPSREGTVFQGLEGSMVRIQEMQAKSILACHRQLREHNLQMVQMTKGFTEFVASNREIATGMGRITTAITQLCAKMDQHEHIRRRDARVQNWAITRLAAATALLYRRGANMEKCLTQNTAEVTRGMARITSAMETLIISNTVVNPALDVAEAGDSSSRSSPASAVSQPRRSSRRSAEAAGHAEGGEPHPSGSAKRSRK